VPIFVVVFIHADLAKDHTKGNCMTAKEPVYLGTSPPGAVSAGYVVGDLD